MVDRKNKKLEEISSQIDRKLRNWRKFKSKIKWPPGTSYCNQSFITCKFQSHLIVRILVSGENTSILIISITPNEVTGILNPFRGLWFPEQCFMCIRIIQWRRIWVKPTYKWMLLGEYIAPHGWWLYRGSTVQLCMLFESDVRNFISCFCNV